MLKNNSKKFFLSFLIIIIIFFFDRVSKLYILNLAETENYLDIYFNSFLNFHLIWNTGIGFGLLSLETKFYYNLITILIILINVIILAMIIKYDDYKIFFLLMILGGSFGNLFDRLYYRAVPDFIDFHYDNFHWFVFNVADIFVTIGIVCLIIVEFILNNKKPNNEKT
ncbi:MAG TPA: signal peptidase II [Candidatus Pelagibacter bacterium]|jgi:signal peptidase II|nr:signal peptidase II [Pelagibacteraceae bacterium]HJN83900.1 signal peptidase II [Candidatus Pelagibacter bacterium]|tara:strand:- start:1161 stop:1664 length:504 start_codon:yes stop_codon:yes gene_type:complete